MTSPKAITSLPKRVMIYGMLLKLFGLLSTTMVYSYLPQLIKSFHISDVQTGFYAGLVSSGNYIARFSTCYLWGLLSDMIGKKHASMISATLVAIATLLFGISLNFTWALTSRILQGLFMGIEPIVKSLIAANCDDSNIALAYTLVVMNFSLAFVLGPILGGYLSFPNQQYPELFHNNGFLWKFPIFLPNIIACACLLFTVVFGMIILPRNDVSSKKKERETEEDNLISSKEKKNKAKLSNVFRNKWLMLICLSYTIFGIGNNGFYELTSLYAATSEKYHGMGYSPSNIGFVISVAGVLAVFGQLFVLPKITRSAGAKKVYIISLVIQCIVYPLLPAVGSINNKLLRMILISVYVFVVRFLHGMSLVPINILVVNSVPVEIFGAANGIATSFGSFGHFIGALSSGIIYAWSLKNVVGVKENVNPLGFPFNQYFTFFVFSLICILNGVIVASLPDELNHRSE